MSLSKAAHELTIEQAYDTCTVLLAFDEDWSGENCEVSYLEVAAAAQAILDDCIGDDQIGGAHMVRHQGNCGSTAILGNPGAS